MKITKTIFQIEDTKFIAIDFSNAPDKCELCGAKSELRPYGPNRRWICFDCGMKFETTTEENFLSIMNGNYNE
jgi:transposase-like protein